MSRSAESQTGETAPHRPAQVAALLVDGGVSETWFGANRTMNRFFVLNLHRVINLLALSHTLSDPYFNKATAVISKETDWPSQFDFDYRSSKNQIYPKKLAEPKRFGTAATAIIALELASEATGSKVNVYDYLRILPATCFIDGVDEAWLTRADHWAHKTHGEPIGALLENKLVRSRHPLGASASLLKELSQGYCLTRWTAEHLFAAIGEIVPPDLAVGPLYEAGAHEPSSWKLGTKNAAPSMKVPKFRDPDDLPPLQS